MPTGEQKPENFDNDLRVDDPNESIKKSNDTDFTAEDLMDYTDCSEESPEYVREPDEVPPKPPDTDSAHCNIESPQLPEASPPLSNQTDEISLNQRLPNYSNSTYKQDAFSISNQNEPFVKIIMSKDHGFKKTK